MTSARGQNIGIATAGLMIVITLASTADAQSSRDTREQERVVVREVLREVTRVVPDIMREISQDISREMPSIVREVRREMADQQRGNTMRAEQTARETKTLALGATGSLELRNLAGDISVTAGTGRDVTVEIVRHARGRTDADAKTGLERVKVNVTHQGDRAEVRTEYPDERQPAYSVSVSYTVTAPAGTRVTINSASGDANVKGVKGQLSVNLLSGDIDISGAGRVSEARTFSGDVTLADVTSDEGVTLGTVSGDVTLQGVRARRLDVDVTSGDIAATDVTCESAEMRSLSGNIHYAGPLARGGRYRLQTHSGSVHVDPTGGVGFEFEGSTFSGSIRAASGITMKTNSSSRRQMRGTVGDGGATVVATTFSGNVVVGKQ